MKMKSIEIFSKLMKPFLEEYGFEVQELKEDCFLFVCKENPSVQIRYTLGSKCNQVCGEIKKFGTRIIPINV